MLLDAGWTIQNFRELNFAAGIVRPQLGLKSSPRTPAAASGAGFGGAQPPIKLIRDSRRVTLASGTFSARTRRTCPRSNLLSKRSVKAGRVMMTYAEKRRRRTVSIF